MKGIKPTETEIAEMQSYYDTGVSVQKVGEKFGWWKGTLFRYLTVRHPKVSPEERRKRRIENVVTWRQRTKRKLVEYKGGKCKVCGYSKCMDNLTFHHLDPSKKDFQISGTNKAFETLKAETDKCVLLCRNCHGEVHAGILQV